MKYYQIITLKNGIVCCLRNGTEQDGQAVLDHFNLTHGETDYLLSYPDENSFTAEQERQFLKEKAESRNEVEILAVVCHTVAGTAGIEAAGSKYKIRHRAGYQRVCDSPSGRCDHERFTADAHVPSAGSAGGPVYGKSGVSVCKAFDGYCGFVGWTGNSQPVASDYSHCSQVGWGPCIL